MATLSVFLSLLGSNLASGPQRISQTFYDVLYSVDPGKPQIINQSQCLTQWSTAGHDVFPIPLIASSFGLWQDDYFSAFLSHPRLGLDVTPIHHLVLLLFLSVIPHVLFFSHLVYFCDLQELYPTTRIWNRSCVYKTTVHTQTHHWPFTVHLAALGDFPHTGREVHISTFVHMGIRYTPSLQSHVWSLLPLSSLPRNARSCHCFV